MSQKVSTFLMFQGQAEEALTFYADLFAEAELLALTKWPAGGPGKEGTVQQAVLLLGGQTILANDSTVEHDFTFTPSTSLFVQCDSEEEIDRVYAALAEGGSELMPLADYGFSRRFGWTNDRFGVSWQLNLA
ncbi:PhnB protein [Actinokineospora spheciospongiae]|uniref:PhnB protein n=1 Tax=Actinokineospora spheciospongiae TaxID=909613 RepID=W7IR53_9PSEU|nr:VOC family protein [Actinokineospora spheciospongiae]EWC63460.1 PhnB protein [Actinokineospora spheciospongiae]PWW64209.1 putative 3-demethylubiquinone-9 3-methyltransferase (glyoxalase superfamily) [Actinokineospora spheciospongiae]